MAHCVAEKPQGQPVLGTSQRPQPACRARLQAEVWIAATGLARREGVGGWEGGSLAGCLAGGLGMAMAALEKHLLT